MRGLCTITKQGDNMPTAHGSHGMLATGKNFIQIAAKIFSRLLSYMFSKNMFKILSVKKNLIFIQIY